MLELPLHLGYEHPSLLWVVIPSILSFAAGVGVGMYAGNSEGAPATETVTEHE